MAHYFVLYGPSSLLLFLSQFHFRFLISLHCPKQPTNQTISFNRTQLGWKYNILKSTPLEEFETIRSPQRSPNFDKDKRLTRHERQRILREFGFTDKDIQVAAKRAAIIRNKRKRSIELMRHDHLYEALEEVKIFICGGCKTASDAVLENYGSKVHPSLVADQDC